MPRKKEGTLVCDRLERLLEGFFGLHPDHFPHDFPLPVHEERGRNAPNSSKGLLKLTVVDDDWIREV